MEQHFKRPLTVDTLMLYKYFLHGAPILIFKVRRCFIRECSFNYPGGNHGTTLEAALMSSQA
jgi:hypothetical protein